MPQLVSGVNVTLTIEQGATPSSAFGRVLCLENIATAQTLQRDVLLRSRVRVYNDAASVREAGEVSAVQDAADIWFGGTREPQAFMVGTQFGAAQPRMIYGGEFTVAEAEGLGDGYSLNLGSRSISIDLDTLSDFAAIAGAVQAGLNADDDITGAVVTVVDGNRLQIQLPATLAGSITIDDTGDELGLGPDDNPVYFNGIAAPETSSVALGRLTGLNPDFTFVGLPVSAYNDISGVEDADERIAALSTWVQANDRIFEFADYGAQVLTDNDATSNSALQFALKRPNVAYSYTGDLAGLLPFGHMRVLSAVEYTQVGTARNVANRILPGLTPLVLTDAQAAELDRKRVNYYRREGNLQHTRGGRTAGEWYEAAVYLLWIKNAIALAAYNYNLSLEYFAGTNDDYAGLRRAMSVPLGQSVDSGFVSPGPVSDSVRDHIRRTTGNPGFDGVLEDGYLVWNADAATATAAQLSARDSLPVYFWVKGTPLINNITISGNYAR
ncbi:MAG: DUF3383 family protein [Gemmatimonadota bacterium]|nr:DUF3383 family protein [Gemmatimonadota bacterium]